MIPDKILQSDLLDILFENKNKSYGAYFLRRHYHFHLMKALFITAAISVSFFLFLQFKPVNQISKAPLLVIPDGNTVIDVIVERERTEPETARPQPAIPQARSIDYQQVLIVPDHIQQNVVDVNVLQNANISNVTTDGVPDAPVDVVEPISGNGYENAEAVVAKPVEPAEPAVLNFAEIMPAYPGGVQALKRFMERNLIKPDNLEPGDKVVIKAKFIVGVTGIIEQVELLNEGPQELKRSILQTIAKMPAWTPGMQNGHPVSVYFVLPITFIATDD